MRVKTLSIPLSESELKTLEQLAGRECRTPRNQARYMLRTALETEQAGNEKPAARSQVTPGQPV